MIQYKAWLSHEQRSVAVQFSFTPSWNHVPLYILDMLVAAHWVGDADLSTATSPRAHAEQPSIARTHDHPSAHEARPPAHSHENVLHYMLCIRTHNTQHVLRLHARKQEHQRHRLI